MPDIPIKIKSLLNGQQTAYHVGGEGQFLDSLGIDPDHIGKLSDTQKKASGVITPTTYTAFSGANVNSAPVAIITNPKDALVYAILANGRLISYSSALASETLIGTVTGSQASGATYYNNFIYIFGTGTNGEDISTFGPLQAGGVAKQLLNGQWTGGALGDASASVTGQPNLNDTTYPSFGSVEYPNHWGHAHVDNQLYFTDFNDGRGYIHVIKTATDLLYDNQTGNFTVGLVLTGGTSGATATIANDVDAGATGVLTLTNVQGVFQDGETITDTSTGSADANGIATEGGADNGSAYNVLDLPSGYMPTDIESYGTDLIISAIQTSDSVLNQGPSALFLWDPTDVDSFYRQIDLEEFPLTSALQNKGGSIFVFSGNEDGGHSVGVYDDAFGVTPIEFFADGNPPFAGAVGVYGNRISWGSQRTFDNTRACVYSLGYKSPRLPRSAIHNIARTSLSAGTSPVVSAINYGQLASGLLPRLLIGSRSSSQFKIDSLDTGASTQTSEITFGPFNVGQPFSIQKVRIPLSDALTGGSEITPTFKFDDANEYELDTINDTNFSLQRFVIYKQPNLSETQSGTLQAQGKHQFTFKLAFTGTQPLSVLLPILIVIRTQEIDDK